MHPAKINYIFYVLKYILMSPLLCLLTLLLTLFKMINHRWIEFVMLFSMLILQSRVYIVIYLFMSSLESFISFSFYSVIIFLLILVFISHSFLSFQYFQQYCIQYMINILFIFYISYILNYFLNQYFTIKPQKSILNLSILQIVIHCLLSFKYLKISSRNVYYSTS